MGWWPWSSPGVTPPGADSASEDKSNNSGFGLTEEQKLRIFGPSSSSSNTSHDISQKSFSREEQADAELDAFLRSFSTSATDQDSQQSSNGDSTLQQHTQDLIRPRQETDYSRILPDGSLNVHPSALHPRTMSCRAAFDQAFYCQSLGGKFNDIYRFGQLKDCSEQWSAFWFCMRTRTLPEKEKQNQIRDFYEQRDMRRKKERGSSEDVWEIREKAVEKAFWKDPDAEDEPHEPLVRG